MFVRKTLEFENSKTRRFLHSQGMLAVSMRGEAILILLIIYYGYNLQINYYRGYNYTTPTVILYDVTVTEVTELQTHS